jgi:hypothetical protein
MISERWHNIPLKSTLMCERGGNFLLSPATTKLLKNNYFSYLLYSLCRFLYPEVNGFEKTFQTSEKDSTCWNPIVISDFSN